MSPFKWTFNGSLFITRALGINVKVTFYITMLSMQAQTHTKEHYNLIIQHTDSQKSYFSLTHHPPPPPSGSGCS